MMMYLIIAMAAWYVILSSPHCGCSIVELSANSDIGSSTDRLCELMAKITFHTLMSGFFFSFFLFPTCTIPLIAFLSYQSRCNVFSHLSRSLLSGHMTLNNLCIKPWYTIQYTTGLPGFQCLLQ